MTPPDPAPIDLRGLRCPWPALRVARALRDGAGAALVAVADDPAAPAEIAAVARAHGRGAAAVHTAIGPGIRLDAA